MEKNLKNKLLSALFAESKKLHIDADELRDVIAPNVLGKRLSEAKSLELVLLLTHITGGKKRFLSSKSGLLQELEHEARARWGENFKEPLLAFINSHGFKGTLTHYRFMGITDLKAFKTRLRVLNRKDGI